MEDNIQTIIVVIISAFLLFIFPVYVAYEKKDDISYALAMRYTQDLVDEVRSKGYLTKNMYEDYRAKLKLTGNTYDIQLTHEYNRYDPITNYYKLENGKYVLVKTTTREEREKFEQEAINEGINRGYITENSSNDRIQEYLNGVYQALPQPIAKVEDTYQLSKEIYTEDHIVAVLNSERKLQLNSTSEVVSCSDDETDDGCQYAYIMNVDDNFNITIKNTNITLATLIYNMVTANTLDSNTRIYVNYGGAILSNKWQGNVDYSKMDHDNILLNKFTQGIIFDDERTFGVLKNGVESYPTEDKAKINGTEDKEKKIIEYCSGVYVLDFDVKPNAVTDLREKGLLSVADYAKYNFAAGNNRSSNEDSMLSVSVGLNGISLITNTTKKYKAAAIGDFEQYKKVKWRREKTISCKMEKEYISEGQDGEQIITKQYEIVTCSDIVDTTDITDYKNIAVKYVSEGRFSIDLEGKSGVNNVNVIVDTNTGTRLSQLNYSKNNPSGNIAISGNLTDITTYSGQTLKYYIDISNSELEIEEEEEESTELSDYSNAHIEYVNGKIELTMTSQKSNVSNFTKRFEISNDAELLEDLDVDMNPQDTEREIRFERNINARSTDITGKIKFSQNGIEVSVDQNISQEMTILSYPVTIDEYTNIRIEMKATEQTKDLEQANQKYIALLYIDDEKVDESIELDVIPKVNVVGKTIIGNEERFFSGNIKNAKIYSLANN